MTFIVAECGVNFDNGIEAGYMICAAKNAGVDAVKFQCYNHDTLCKLSGGEVERHPFYDRLMKIRIDESRLNALKQIADRQGVELIVTPMYGAAVNMLERAGVQRYKIRYADRHNEGLLEVVQATGKPIIISCREQKVFDFPAAVVQNLDQFTFMYCIPEYPPDAAKFKEVPLTFTSPFTGYSNHYPSIIPPLIAAARGAEIIEVHVKLPGTYPLDDAVSLDMDELAELCTKVREIEEFL